MPSLSKHQSNLYTKLLIMGDSGSGKTGALASLVCDGFKLRILDMDNGLETLKTFVEKNCHANLENVEYRTLRDKYKSTAAGPIIDGVPKAFVEAVKMLDRWKYKDGDVEVDLGPPAEWGSECILVIDSLTFLSDAAWDWREPLTPRGSSGQYDKRAVYGDAQDAIEKVLALLTGENFRTNVIVIAHIRYVDNPDGTKKGYPTAVGSALSPTIPRYFNSVALCTNIAGKRSIQTTATAMIDLKNPKPFEMLKSYDLSDGLSKFFKVLRGDIQIQEPKPTPVISVNPTVQPGLRRIGK
jgi:hypothetical protein